MVSSRTRVVAARLALLGGVLVAFLSMQSSDDKTTLVSCAIAPQTPALTRAALEDALQRGDMSSVAAAILALRHSEMTDPLQWLSQWTVTDDGARRYPNAERLGRWLGDFDAALDAVGPDDPRSLAAELIERLASPEGGNFPGESTRDELLSDLAAGRMSLSRTVDQLATREMSASDLESAVSRGRRSAAGE